MKTHLLLLACVFASFGPYASVQAAHPPGVPLRYVTAADAFTAIHQQLGGDAAEAVSRVDDQRNVIALDWTHTEAAIVRAFLAGFDHRPPQVRVDATITRRLEATATSPPRDEVLSRRTLLPQAGRPELFSIPGDHGSTQIELRVTRIAK